MVKRARLTGIEKFLNNNCFMVFLFLFMLVVCYVMGIKNRKVKENFTKQANRRLRKTIEGMKKSHNKRVVALENKMNSGFRNNTRRGKEKFKDLDKTIQGVFKKFSFK